MSRLHSFLTSLYFTLLICFPALINAQAQPQRSMDKEFLDAVQKRDVTKFQSLLSKGANINAKEPVNGHFALQYAITLPDAGLVKLLLDKGADVNASDRNGNTALLDATRESGPEYAIIARLLIDRGADIHANHDASIFAAVREADPSVVQLLLKKGAPVNAIETAKDGDTVLMSAAGGASVESLQILLDAGADVKSVNQKGETVLMKASTMDHRYTVETRLPMIELLLEKGAEINARDKSGRTALLHAVFQQMTERGGVISHPEVVQLLLDRGADVKVKDKNGDSALIVTVGVWHGPIEIVQLLLARGIDVDAQNDKGISALMVAADEGSKEVVQLLAGKSSNLNLKDVEGWTALDHAIEKGHPDLARLLLSKGASARNTYKNDTEVLTAAKDSALLRATMYNRLDEVEELLAQGANANARDRRGHTALILAAGNSYGQMDILKLLLAKGADVDAANANGETALMWTAMRNSGDVTKVLLAKKARVNIRNKKGQTALHIAAAGFHADIVEALLANGAEVDAPDQDGKTALILAANSAGIVPDYAMDPLLNKGADVNAQDNMGNSALIIAAQSGSAAGVEFLLSKGAKSELRNKDGLTALAYAHKLHENQKLYNATLVETRIVALLEKAGVKE
jgi:ankyrin repeat protein